MTSFFQNLQTYIQNFPHRVFFIVFVLGVLARSYGITDHWKTNDHYNYGGAITTNILNCSKQTPFSISRGLMVFDCEEGKPPTLYSNHSPAFLYPMWLITDIFGTTEWAVRLSTLIFSLANIILVYILAGYLWADPFRPVLASFFQAFFLGPMYFGTHIDPITEFSLTPMLISAIYLVRGKTFLSCLWALIAGLTAWVGFFQFVGILVYKWLKKEKLTLAITLTVISAVICFAFIMYLKNTTDIVGFVYMKLFDNKYIDAQSRLDQILWPFRFIKTVLASQSRMLSPLFAAIAFYEIIWGSLSGIWTFSKEKLRSVSEQTRVLLLLGLPGITYSLAGPKYVMVHIYSFQYIMPFYAFLCAIFVYDCIWNQPRRHIYVKGYVVLSVLFLVLYPYGAFKSSVVHDAFTSILLITSALSVVWFIAKKEVKSSVVTSFIFLSAFGNFNQVMNYRGEADTEYTFCEKARLEYEQTGQPVRTNESRTRTKDYLYCKGIPIIYENENTN